jgi:hypothetical protein
MIKRNARQAHQYATQCQHDKGPYLATCEEAIRDACKRGQYVCSIALRTSPVIIRVIEDLESAGFKVERSYRGRDHLLKIFWAEPLSDS